jgi:hypothetical protein
MGGPSNASLVDNFILNYIDSVAELEILALLKNFPELIWTSASISLELRSSDLGASRNLQQLVRKGLISQDIEHFFYAPNTEELLSALDLTLLAYQDRRVSVITAIYSKPAQRIKIFADAFKIGKKD